MSWLKPVNMPGQTFSLDKKLSDQFNGIYQISVYGQRNQGKGGILALIDSLVTNYKAGGVFTDSGAGTEVNIVMANPSNLKPDGSFIKIDLSIQYFVFVDRN